MMTEERKPDTASSSSSQRVCGHDEWGVSVFKRGEADRVERSQTHWWQRGIFSGEDVRYDREAAPGLLEWRPERLGRGDEEPLLDQPAVAGGMSAERSNAETQPQLSGGSRLGAPDPGQATSHPTLISPALRRSCSGACDAPLSARLSRIFLDGATAG